MLEGTTKSPDSNGSRMKEKSRKIVKVKSTYAMMYGVYANPAILSFRVQKEGIAELDWHIE